MCTSHWRPRPHLGTRGHWLHEWRASSFEHAESPVCQAVSPDVPLCKLSPATVTPPRHHHHLRSHPRSSCSSRSRAAEQRQLPLSTWNSCAHLASHTCHFLRAQTCSDKTGDRPPGNCPPSAVAGALSIVLSIPQTGPDATPTAPQRPPMDSSRLELHRQKHCPLRLGLAGSQSILLLHHGGRLSNVFSSIHSTPARTHAPTP